THAAVSRLGKPIPGMYWIAVTALTLSTAATLTYVIGVVIEPRPWWEPQYLVPIAGMILGNSMTSAALAGDRLQSDLFARRDEVEARLALGFSGPEAGEPLVRAALRAAIIPSGKRVRGGGGGRPAAGDDDGSDSSRCVPADGDPVSDGGRIHDGRGHRARIPGVRAPCRGPIFDASAPAEAVPPLTSGRSMSSKTVALQL